MRGTCENCGFPDVELVPVRRAYVVPEQWDTPGSVTIVPEPEAWCVSCASQYPHEPVEPVDPDGPEAGSR